MENKLNEKQTKVINFLTEHRGESFTLAEKKYKKVLTIKNT